MSDERFPGRILLHCKHCGEVTPLTLEQAREYVAAIQASIDGMPVLASADGRTAVELEVRGEG